MSPTVHIGDHAFRFERDFMDVTSISRPNERWFFTDPAGHVHQWWQHRPHRPMDSYRPDQRYVLPSLTYVVDDPGDDENPPIGHYECRLCHARVTPGTTADDTQQLVAGLMHLYIDGVEVTKAMFDAKWIEAQANANADSA